MRNVKVRKVKIKDPLKEKIEECLQKKKKNFFKSMLFPFSLFKDYFLYLSNAKHQLF